MPDIIGIIRVTFVNDVFNQVISPRGVDPESAFCEKTVICEFHILYFSKAFIDVPVDNIISN